MPPFAQVFGPPEQEVTSLSTLNFSVAQMYEIFTGKQQDPKNSVWLWVDVKDLARAHVVAVKTPSAANQRYLVTGGSYSVQQFLDFVWENYPERAERLKVARGTPGKLWPEGGTYTADNSRSVRDLGLRYRSVEEMCKETFERFVQLEKVYGERW